jgi:hypothetical protein
MFEKSKLLLAWATRSRAPVAHGGNPQLLETLRVLYLIQLLVDVA